VLSHWRKHRPIIPAQMLLVSSCTTWHTTLCWV